ncbi:hypothetical protein AXG93_2637s1130 [Marchantia polymorpha subsp. ruderalis]|uniref:Myb-like domain-containing protein n=1 Tax=Marchantia polymorpha subsp. ruderalis TaxID=1480154 RepID=A0A176VGG1_MARPO|nr:hypothetical protein AXG93_2637s1130 [Marchantia polymorpha subsp. ruderalis]
MKLIRLRTYLESRFAKSGRKTELWDEIAEALQRERITRDAQQCRDKWEKLTARYKEVRDGVKDREENPFYDELHPLLLGKSLKREQERDKDIFGSGKEGAGRDYSEKLSRELVVDGFTREIDKDGMCRGGARGRETFKDNDDDGDEAEARTLSRKKKGSRIERLEGPQGPKRRSKNWKRAEVLQLIKLRGGMDSQIVKSTRRAALWKELAELLAAQGIKRNGKQCREKWDKLMAEYNDVADGKRDQGFDQQGIVAKDPKGRLCVKVIPKLENSCRQPEKRMKNIMMKTNIMNNTDIRFEKELDTVLARAISEAQYGLTIGVKKMEIVGTTTIVSTGKDLNGRRTMETTVAEDYMEQTTLSFLQMEEEPAAGAVEQAEYERERRRSRSHLKERDRETETGIVIWIEVAIDIEIMTGGGTLVVEAEVEKEEIGTVMCARFHLWIERRVIGHQPHPLTAGAERACGEPTKSAATEDVFTDVEDVSASNIKSDEDKVRIR